MSFSALLLDREGGGMQARIATLEEDRLPAGDTLIGVEYSSLNYKDGLAVTGKGKIVRGPMPFVPGIDLAGTILSTGSASYRPGQKVIVTGWGIGETRWGGFSQKARVRSEWMVPLPDGLDTLDAMTIGTAGLTAMLAILTLEAHGTTPDAGEIVVSGATGGVGSFSVALLASRGFDVVASTGGADAEKYLRSLGARRLIDRSELPAAAVRPLDSSRWGGAVDTVGGPTLAGILSQLRTHGSVSACGNASGGELHTTVYPFILRGVNLLGIDSNTAPVEQRIEAWRRLALDLSKDVLGRIRTETVSLRDLPDRCELITEGKIDGRVVVDVNG